MELITKKGMPSNFNLFLFSCTHFGSKLCHEDGIDQLIDMILSPYGGLPARANYCLHHGDAIEGILIDDKRFHPDTANEIFPMKQIDYAAEKLKPIASKMVGLLEGNHERKLWKFGNLSELLAHRLGVRYGTFSARITYRDRKGRLLFKHFATHGQKAIRSYADDPERVESNENLILKRHLKPFGGDCMLNTKAHVHKLLICKPKSHLFMTDDGEQIKQKYTSSDHTAKWIHPDHRWYLCVGAFYKIYEIGINSYVELGEYPPNALGFLVAKIRDREIQEVDKVLV